MRRLPLSVSVVTSIVIAFPIAAGCGRSGSTPAGSAAPPLSPSAVTPDTNTGSPGAGAASAVTPGLPDRIVTMMDACDPETFNAPPPAGVGPGACVRSGGVTFANFLEQLGRHQVVGSWMFAPPQTSAKVGQVFVAVNQGGEEHTFTEVQAFGGGIVPPLNTLSGNPDVAPECANLGPDDFVAPGETYREEPLESAGTARFQCCIHPWMRLEVKVAAR